MTVYQFQVYCERLNEILGEESGGQK